LLLLPYTFPIPQPLALLTNSHRLLRCYLLFHVYFFYSIRTQNHVRQRRLETIADYLFAISLTGIVIIILLLLFHVINNLPNSDSNSSLSPQIAQQLSGLPKWGMTEAMFQLLFFQFGFSKPGGRNSVASTWQAVLLL